MLYVNYISINLGGKIKNWKLKRKILLRKAVNKKLFYISAKDCRAILSFWLPSGSDSKESTCNAADPGSIPGSGRSSGEGNETPGCLPGRSHGQGSLSGYSPWICKESDTTEALSTHALPLSLLGLSMHSFCPKHSCSTSFFPFFWLLPILLCDLSS